MAAEERGEIGDRHVVQRRADHDEVGPRALDRLDELGPAHRGDGDDLLVAEGGGEVLHPVARALGHEHPPGPMVPGREVGARPLHGEPELEGLGEVLGGAAAGREQAGLEIVLSAGGEEQLAVEDGELGALREERRGHHYGAEGLTRLQIGEGGQVRHEAHGGRREEGLAVQGLGFPPTGDHRDRAEHRRHAGASGADFQQLREKPRGLPTAETAAGPGGGPLHVGEPKGPRRLAHPGEDRGAGIERGGISRREPGELDRLFGLVPQHVGDLKMEAGTVGKRCRHGGLVAPGQGIPVAIRMRSG